MKTLYYPFAFAACLLIPGWTSFADDGSAASVGDLPGFGEDAYFGDEPAFAGESDPAEADRQSDGAVTQASIVDSSPARRPRDSQRRPRYAPIDASVLQPVGHTEGYAEPHYVGDGDFVPACDGCDAGCDGCCDSGYYAASCSISGNCKIGRVIDCNTWMTAEALLWFPQARKLPVLVASAPTGVSPVLAPGGQASGPVVNEFGGEVEGGISGGFRIDYGRWLAPNFGVGGRFWIIGENGDSYRATDVDGSLRSLSIPFFEINPGAIGGIGESGLLIGFLGNQADIEGSVAVESNLKMLAAEAYGRFRLGRAANHQLDLIGGYSFFQIDDSLSIFGESIDNVADESRRFNDAFEAENRFHGGQLGFELSACRGRWMARSLTKVHLGNMNQTYDIQGNSTFINSSGVVQNREGGIFTQPVQPDGSGNIGERSRDVFAFVPELNFKLGYRFRPNVLLSVGYSFLYFDNVALNGAVFDRTVNGPNLASGVTDTPTGFAFDDSSLWVQGIDLGVVIDF